MSIEQPCAGYAFARSRTLRLTCSLVLYRPTCSCTFELHGGIDLNVSSCRSEKQKRIDCIDPVLIRFRRRSCRSWLMETDAFPLFRWIGDVAPCFPVAGHQIRILRDPREFYETLKAREINESPIKLAVLSKLIGH